MGKLVLLHFAACFMMSFLPCYFCCRALFLCRWCFVLVGSVLRITYWVVRRLLVFLFFCSLFFFDSFCSFHFCNVSCCRFFSWQQFPYGTFPPCFCPLLCCPSPWEKFRFTMSILFCLVYSLYPFFVVAIFTLFPLVSFLVTCFNNYNFVCFSFFLVPSCAFFVWDVWKCTRITCRTLCSSKSSLHYLWCSCDTHIPHCQTSTPRMLATIMSC